MSLANGSAAAVRSRVHSRLLADASGPVRVEQLAALVGEEAPLLGTRERARVVEELLAEVQGLGPLEPLLADPGVTEVMVNGPDQVWVERAGRLERVPLALDAPAIEHLIEKIVGPLGLRVDRSSPLVDARLPDGSRVNAVVPPLAVDGPCLTIRRFGARPVPLEAFAPEPVVSLLSWAVGARLNLLVSGGTGAGKTTLLNALAGRIPPGERVVTVEDAAELRLPGEHVVRLEARPPNAEGAGAVRMRDLVRNALRMRPDRIVVGEVRGPEALDMLQAMNTAHEGSLSTCHANGPADALRRLETMVLMGDVDLPLGAVRSQLEAGLDLVVQVARGRGGTRRIVEVAEVVDSGSEDDAEAVGDDGLPAPRRPAGGRVVADGRRPPAGRVARQRDRAAAGGARRGADDPEVLGRSVHGEGPRRLRHGLAGRVAGAGGLRARQAQRARLGRDRHRQDHAAERALVVRPRGRARDHDRGLGR
ncbi:MAG TPA: CpaF family protein, partial [Acidimicrobiales bacterium]|nr:CpaF family protein [Acidimicrobiales bacterium]